MGFVGNYAPCGLSPQMYDMPVIHPNSHEGDTDTLRGYFYFHAAFHEGAIRLFGDTGRLLQKSTVSRCEAWARGQPS